jgi:hypothetical protein
VAEGGDERGAVLAEDRVEEDEAGQYMSGYAEDTIVKQGVLEGAVALLPKPFIPEAFAPDPGHPEVQRPGAYEPPVGRINQVAAENTTRDLPRTAPRSSGGAGGGRS